MDCVSPVLSIAQDVLGCAARRASLISELRDNLGTLEEEMDTLIRRSEDVQRRLELQKQQQQLIPGREVEGWLQRVQKQKSEVTAIQQKGNTLLEQPCMGRCWNLRSTYKLGKRVSRYIMQVKELTSKGDFETLAYEVPCPVVEEIPLGFAVGLDSLNAEVCSCLANEEVRVVGLYGKRGLGKTTLMKKINNGLLGTHHQFDVVIWVTVSTEASVRAAQEVIGGRLGIIDGIWRNEGQDGKAMLIFRCLRSKRFLLLLDDLHEPFDFSEIGVPHPDARNRSKVVIASGFREVCILMKADRWFEVKPLVREHAWSLFIEQLRGDARTLAQQDPEIQTIAYSILDRCKGSPSVIITAGRISAHFETPGKWLESMPMVGELIANIIPRTDENRHSPISGDEMPLGHTMGFDSLYVRLCNCLDENEGGIIGLYGTGGVGKTTLMKKIYKCLKTGRRFDTVIWVPMSKQENAQEVIRNKLQIPDSMWQSRTAEGRAVEVFNIMKAKKFLLLLDDVWQRLDLLEIGIPPLVQIDNGSKIIITTRFQNICTEMEVPVERQFRVAVLGRKDALALFLEKVGQNALSSHPDIPRLAEKVAEYCKGLPLALITVGRAMAGKSSPEAWDQAIQELENFPAEISGMEDRLFHVLKLSYDSLKDDITKCCFIYYSFFPKDYEIRNDELVEHWIGEGFVDCVGINEARRVGLKIIEELKNACLLEEGDGFKECIKMHNVIHDMALWIGQECGKKTKKIFVCKSHEHIKRRTNWMEAKVISLWGRNIEKLPQTPQCFNLETLFVRECVQLRTFPIEFFQFMPLLRVLDLSATHGLTKLPNDIDLLINLEYINLSMTQIYELPRRMMKLERLRCLLLNGMPPLIIPSKVISSLSSLQLFSMFDGNALSRHQATFMEELESIESLDEISLSFRSVVTINKLLTSHKLQMCTRKLSIYDCGDLVLLKLSSIFLYYLETLVIAGCLQWEEMKINVEIERSIGFKQTHDILNPNLIVRNNHHFHRPHDVKIWSCPKLKNLTWLIYAANLQSLNVQVCGSVKDVVSCVYITSSIQHVSIFTRLRSLVLGAMPMLESIYQGALLFPSLEVISVINCPRLGRLPFNPNGAPKSLKKIEGDLTWWECLRWDEEGMEELYVVYFSPQYLADPMDPSEKMKGKKKLVVEGPTSRATT